MIVVENLSKKYGKFLAVDNLSFTVQSGEILGLVGPNGAGKTTTLRCLVGILPLTLGRIVVAEYDIQASPIEAKKRLAFIPDEPRLFEYLTVWDHMLLFSRLYNVVDSPLRGEELLQEFDLWEKRFNYPAELSRGMKQKTIICLALLHRPQVLVLDEPLTGLDPMAMKKMKETLALTALKGVSIVVSSHMLHLIEELSNKIVIIKQGKKIIEGSLDDIRASIPDLSEHADLEDIFLKATNADHE